MKLFGFIRKGAKFASVAKIILGLLGIGGVFAGLAKFFPQIQDVWVKVTDELEIVFSILIMVAGLAGICAIIIIALVILNKKSKSENSTNDSNTDSSTIVTESSNTKADLLIVLSSILCCICMIPTIAGFNSYTLKSIKKNKIAELDREIDARKKDKQILEQNIEINKKKAELQNKQFELDKKSIEVENLNDTVNLLKSTQANMQTFKEILEVALLETDLKQTSVYKEQLGDIQKSWVIDPFKDYTYEEALAIFTHRFTAKFGIDFKGIKVKPDPHTEALIISGIKPKFIGKSNSHDEVQLAELRKVEYKDGGEKRSILNGPKDHDKMKNFLDKKNKEYEDSVNKGLQTDFMDDAVIKLAKNFIKMILIPLDKKIEFDDNSSTDAISLEEYLTSELKDVENDIEKKEAENKNTVEDIKAAQQNIQKAEEALQQVTKPTNEDAIEENTP